MTKKQLKSDLEALGYSMFNSTAPEGGLLVYKNCEYVCTIHWTKSKLTFNGKSYTNVEKMMEDVAKYNETLEFPANTYCPIYTEESVSLMRMKRTLDDCGFDHDAGINGAYGSDFTVYSDGAFGAHFGTIVDNYLNINSGSFIQMYDMDADDHTKREAVKSMANVLYVTNLAILANKISNIKDITQEINSIPITVVDPNTLAVTTYEGIDGVINLLETTLAKLKKQ